MLSDNTHLLPQTGAMAGTASKAKMLLLRTVAQFEAVRSHKGVPSTASSYRAIERWFAPEDGSAGQAFEKYQPSYSVLANLVNHGVSRGSSLRNVLALRMWLAQHNAKLPVKLRDDEFDLRYRQVRRGRRPDYCP